MFNKLVEFFQSSEKKSSLVVDSSGTPTDQDLIIAAAVLLVEMACADSDFAPSEEMAIGDLLSKHFKIDSDEIDAIVKAAIAARGREEKIDSFVKCINEHFSMVQRQKLLAMLWKVILDDSKIDKYEQRLAVQMKFRFQLTDAQAQKARALAEDGKV